jgi:metal-responsive CopG/Arc/MetJ family transcriptional regulator
MKTAISIPDRIFDAAERVARRLRISRSELYARAVASFVEDHNGDRVSEELDRVYSEMDSKLDPDVARLQSATVLEDDW